jgi:hypothetical protein
MSLLLLFNGPTTLPDPPPPPVVSVFGGAPVGTIADPVGAYRRLTDPGGAVGTVHHLAGTRRTIT